MRTIGLKSLAKIEIKIPPGYVVPRGSLNEIEEFDWIIFSLQTP
ncbi:hypothetical protein C943_03171 [Mariniradius saccharolyticus AK6]|uniref:Uncharacterized protein n=1 Tax=Mariniradius saccharolyticus AK6 TaxID=1239962 RepID=M7XJ57_9BACT|nr:hypothetical protein C943_03171 [Mariniradius saccharolyticus AK6]